MIPAALREFSARLPLLWRGLGLAWRAAPAWTGAWAALLAVQGLLPAAQVWLTKTAVDRLAAALSAADVLPAFAAAWPPVAAIAALWVLGQVLASLAAWVRAVQGELVNDHVKALVHRQALRLDLAFYDRPDSYDLLYRAGEAAAGPPVTLLESVGAIARHAVTLAVLAVFLAAYAPWLPLLLLGSALPGLWVVGTFVLREHEWRVANVARERRAHYFDWLMTERASAAEVRLFDLGPHLLEAYRRVRAGLREGHLGLARAELRAELAASLLAWGGGLAGMGWMLLRASRGAARLGDLVLCYQSFQQGQGLLRSLLESAGQIYRATLALEGLFDFLALEPGVADPPHPVPVPLPLREGVRFEGVTFGYPGSARAALAGLSLTLEAGRVTAVVGQNGSGKSTLVRLLCRFHDPQAGRVLIDGVDVRSLELAALRRQVAVLFQEPVHYHASAAENIAMGALDAAPGAGEIAAAARAAGADGIVRRLPQGYETVLGQWFGGAELSVGEWQRLALARAFLRDAAIVVLDEPTSAMDSWAEAAWLARFRDVTAGRTALIITHRFTTAMHADVVHVLEAGRVVESGTHAELVAAGGRYAVSWHAQMRAAGADR